MSNRGILQVQLPIIRIINSLYNEYIKDKLPITREFLTNPLSGQIPAPTPALNNTYYSMADEAASVSAAMNRDIRLRILNTTTIPALVRLLICYADGKVAFDSSKPIDCTNAIAGQNNWSNSQSNVPTSFINDNHATRRPIQELNVLNNLKLAYQTKLASSHASPPLTPVYPNVSPVYITEARIVERAGCNGDSNIGFILLSIEVDIN